MVNIVHGWQSSRSGKDNRRSFDFAPHDKVEAGGFPGPKSGPGAPGTRLTGIAHPEPRRGVVLARGLVCVGALVGLLEIEPRLIDGALRVVVGLHGKPVLVHRAVALAG